MCLYYDDQATLYILPLNFNAHLFHLKKSLEHGDKVLEV